MSDDEGALVLLPPSSHHQRPSDDDELWHDQGGIHQSSHQLGSDEAGEDLFPSNGSKEKKGSSTFLFISASMAALGGLLFGYDIGIISAALPQVKQTFALSCAEQEAVVSLMLVGALFASLVGGSLIDRIGSRLAIIANAVVFVVGALVLAASPNLPLLLVGRFIVGFAVALSAVSECIYISEIATPNNRGMLVSLNEVAIVLGFLVAYVVGLVFAGHPQGWRYMFGLSAIPAAGQLMGMLRLPNSPHYLVARQREREAEDAVKQFRQLEDPGQLRQELTNIRLSLEAGRSATCWTLCSAAEGLRSGLVISMGVVLAQQFTGQPNVLSYASTIFQQVGFCGDGLLGSSLPVVGLGVVKLVATVVSLLVIDRLGRRFTLLSGAFVMAFSLVVLSAFAFVQQQTGSGGMEPACSANSTEGTTATNSTAHCPPSDVNPSLRYTALAALMSYVAAYSFSFGPVTWLLLAELFPPAVKGRAAAVSTSLNWAANLLISATFLQTVQVLTLGGVFCFYAILTVLSALFIFLAVPETNRKTLHRISKELRTTSFRQRALQHIAQLPCLCNRFARRVQSSVGGRYAQLSGDAAHQSSLFAETAIQ